MIHSITIFQNAADKRFRCSVLIDSCLRSQILCCTTGYNNNAGTLSSPLKSIQKGIDVLRTGDTCYVSGRGGYVGTERDTHRDSGVRRSHLCLKTG
jgi:hypothetical protein